MSAQRRRAAIQETKEKSKKGHEKLILKDEKGEHREFFRYEGGELAEYQLTIYQGKKIFLRQEELEGLNKFFSGGENK